ncbi:biotin-independent malonate decarboxylase subunit gamma [Oxalobacter sp. OttesenSCG-928-P03]|nr:biotin-independent malonate decarboxylase subunit gamma [Oxalobacter sp. OttesenSCG-928-P03]
MKIPSIRGATWFDRLTDMARPMPGLSPSIRMADGMLDGESVRFITVVPDPDNHYPRAVNGEVGLLEGWSLAKAVHQTMNENRDKTVKCPIVCIIDVPSQAYGRREEAFGIHQALAGAVSAYAQARLLGHPLVGLIVGNAMSGAFLAHGYQASRLVAFNDPGVQIQAMGKASAARITLRTVEALEELVATIPPMAYDVGSFRTLGLLSDLLDISNPDTPSDHDVSIVKIALLRAISEARKDSTLTSRLGAENRARSSLVRERMKACWQSEAA